MNRGLSFIILKVIFLQIFFFLTSKYAPVGYPLVFLVSGLMIVLINYYFMKELINFVPYIVLSIIFFVTGFIQDTLLIYFDILKMKSTYPPIWFATLWMVFVCYYGDVFKKMLDFPIWLMAILGAVGGGLAYFRGLALIDVSVSASFYPIVVLVWAFFMPFSLKYFKHFQNKKLLKD